VAGHHQRLEPLDHRDARAPGAPAGALAEVADALAEAGEQRAAFGREPERLGHGAHRVPHVAERLRRDGQHARGAAAGRAERALHVGQARRAGAALVLREHQVGRERAQPVGVHGERRERVAQQAAHLGVDLATGCGTLPPPRIRWRWAGSQSAANERCRRDARQRFDARRVVALVRAPDQPVARAERADDLGQARQQ